MAKKISGELAFKLDTRIYPTQAIQAAAYTFTDRAFVRIAQDGADAVAIRFKAKTNAKDLVRLSDEFHNELLHEALRLKVSAANQKLREYIVTKALVSAAETQNAVPPAASCAPSAAEAAAPLVDEALEKEIDALLAEIEKAEPSGKDPLGVNVPWEEKHADKGAKKTP
jgi:His-Xaa-Ser system protein HxsD